MPVSRAQSLPIHTHPPLIISPLRHLSPLISFPTPDPRIHPERALLIAPAHTLIDNSLSVLPIIYSAAFHADHKSLFPSQFVFTFLFRNSWTFRAGRQTARRHRLPKQHAHAHLLSHGHIYLSDSLRNYTYGCSIPCIHIHSSLFYRSPFFFFVNGSHVIHALCRINIR